MRQSSFNTGNYYHVYNRGVEKRKIFLDRWDYLRFLETINFYRFSPTPGKLSDFRGGGKKSIKQNTPQTPLVKILSFCLMPNHFHLLLQQVADNGLTKCLHRSSDSYTKFFNAKYDRVGSLFQGPFKAILVETDEYLLQLSKYIHRNPAGLSDIQTYSFSSYPYYLSGETHPFCETEFIKSYFSKNVLNLSYQSFVEDSEIVDPSMFSLFIDPDDLI